MMLPQELIVVISVIGSDGAGAGASKVTRDVADVMAQLPEVVKVLSGVDLNEFLARLQKVSGETKKKD